MMFQMLLRRRRAVEKKKVTMTLLLPGVSYFASFVVKEKDPWNEIVTEIKRFKRRPGS